jgi:hypothetical protein
LSLACSVVAAVGVAYAQLTPPPAITQPVGRSLDDAIEDVQDEIEEQQRATLGLQEWREALGSLAGTWEGTVEVIDATDKTPLGFWHRGDRPELKVVVLQNTAVVSVKADAWRPLNANGGFQATDLTGGGFVYTVDSGNGWVENWNLSLAKKDPDTLLVFLSFVAGGTLERLDAVDTEFAVGAMGELKRRTE